MSPSWGRTMGEECSARRAQCAAQGLKVEERGQGDKKSQPELQFEV